MGKAGHKGLVIGDDGDHLGLLEHEFRDQDGIGIPPEAGTMAGRDPPGQVPGLPVKPGKEGL